MFGSIENITIGYINITIESGHQVSSATIWKAIERKGAQEQIDLHKKAINLLHEYFNSPLLHQEIVQRTIKNIIANDINIAETCLRNLKKSNSDENNKSKIDGCVKHLSKINSPLDRLYSRLIDRDNDKEPKNQQDKNPWYKRKETRDDEISDCIRKIRKCLYSASEQLE